MNRTRTVGGVMMVLFISRFAEGYDFNKEIVNVGPAPADGLTVELCNCNEVTDTVDDGFSGFSGACVSGHIWLMWSNHSPAPVAPLQWVHVGASQRNYGGICDMWWTDPPQRTRLYSNVAYNQTAKGRLIPNPPSYVIEWPNLFEGEPPSLPPVNITYKNARYAKVVQPYALADLNGQNTTLLNSLAALPDGASFDVAPGATATIPIPGGLSVGEYLVLVYDVYVDTTQHGTDYVQFSREELVVPTTSAWGLAILLLSLVAAGSILLRTREVREA